MKRKERFLKAVGGGCPDRVPMFDFLFQEPLYEALIGHRPGTYNARDVVACALALDHDAVSVSLGSPEGWEARYLDESTYADEWGTVHRRTEASWPIDPPVDYPIRGREDLAHYRPPDPTLGGRSADLESFWTTGHDDLALTASVTGPFTKAWLLMGYERICYTLYDDPRMLTDIFKMSNAYSKEAARLCARAGCHAIWIAEDLGDSTRGFLRLKHFRDIYLPHLVELVDAIAALGVPVLLHSCGHITEYLPDLAQTKIAAIHPLQRTAGMDLRWVKEHYGGRFCIIGNIDSSRTLPYGTPADVAAEVREAIDIAAPGGGYVLASDHSIHDGIPVENAIALFSTGRAYGGSFYRKSAGTP